MITAEILAQSQSPYGSKLTTFKVTLPRSILAELNTHRMFSRNAASSRAVPNEKMIEKIRLNPFIPYFAKNQKGMQSAERLEGEDLERARDFWNEMADIAIQNVDFMSKEFNVHKQFTNRLLEPWMYAEVILSATDWDNFFAQRCHPAAEPHFQELAMKMQEAMAEYRECNSLLEIGHKDPGNPAFWHLPMIDDEDFEIYESLDGSERKKILEKICKVLDVTYDTARALYPETRFRTRFLQDIAVGRMTKVSYLNLETGKKDFANDIRLAVQLSSSNPGHWSPFEHVASVAGWDDMIYRISQLEYGYGGGIYPKDGEVGYCGNFKGFKQYRKEFAHENL